MALAVVKFPWLHLVMAYDIMVGTCVIVGDFMQTRKPEWEGAILALFYLVLWCW
jgi:hypothetical protein